MDGCSRTKDNKTSRVHHSEMKMSPSHNENNRNKDAHQMGKRILLEMSQSQEIGPCPKDASNTQDEE